MTTRRNVLTAAPAAGALVTLGAATVTVPTVARAQGTESVGPIWRSQSLRGKPSTAPNGIIAAAETFTVNKEWERIARWPLRSRRGFTPCVALGLRKPMR